MSNKFPDTITHVKSPSGAYSQFEVVDVGSGKIALKSDVFACVRYGGRRGVLA